MDIDRLEHDLSSSDLIGAHGAGETPVLIPNTEVKLSCGDYTA